MPKRFEHMPEHPTEHGAPRMLKHCPSNAPGNAHTYLRTYQHLLTLRNHLTLRNARRGVARFAPADVTHARQAAASRGPMAAR